MKFDVSTQPWIPVVMSDGTSDELSLRDALARAHLVRAVVDPMPTVEFGLHRLLVALVLDIFKPKSKFDWIKLWDAKAFDDAALNRYFANNSDCFDLFDMRKPFLQTADVIPSKPQKDPKKVQAEPNKELRKPVAVLLPSLPTGVNAIHFHHQNEDKFGVCFASAARLLTSVGPFAINIGKGPGGDHQPSSINGRPPIFVLPKGSTLWQTILFNVPVLRDLLIINWGEEIPAWRDPNPARLELKDKVGLVEGLTWQPRQVRLIVGEEGVCDLTGKTEPLVKEILWAQGFLSVERLSEEQKKAKKQPRVLQWQDPNVAYFIADDKRNTITSEEGKELWRDTASLLLLQQSDGPKKRRLPNGKEQVTLFERPAVISQWASLRQEVNIFACNLYVLSTSEAKVEEWQRQELRIGAPLVWEARLHNEAQAAMERAETVFYCLKWAIKKAHRQFPEKADTSLQAIVQKVQGGEGLPSPQDKKNTSRYYVYLRRIENAGLLFWRELRPHYDKFLDFLTRPHDDDARAVARQEYLDRLREVGWRALIFALDDLDGNSRELERQTKAFQTFRASILSTVDPEQNEERKRKAKEKKAKAASTAALADANGQLSLL
jgi:CRISPR type I-E-associated protein CasA/Cse1